MPDPHSVPLARNPQDLSRDSLLRGIPVEEFAGAQRPRLGRTVLVAKLGSGGMGSVYYGVHLELAREVAVKILPIAVSSRMDHAVERFKKEGELARRVRNPHLVEIFEASTARELHYMIHEFVPGVSAYEYLKTVRGLGRPGLVEREALIICRAGAQGLAAAHAAGIIHRDLKPGNLLIPRRGNEAFRFEDVKLTDLGVALLEQGDMKLTGSGATLGSPGFMAPEQARNSHQAGKPSDVWSMGATLFCLLTGKVPFPRETPMLTMLAAVHDELPSVRATRPDIGPATEALIVRCMEKEPAKRFADGKVLAEALEVCEKVRKAPEAEQEKAAENLGTISER